MKQQIAQLLTEKQTEMLTDMRDDMQTAWQDAIAAGKSRQEAIALVRGIARSYYVRGMPWNLCYREMCAVIEREVKGE